MPSRLPLIVSLLLATAVCTVADTVDRIVAVVGNEVILATELGQQVQTTVFQSRTKPKTEAEVKALTERILEQMISEQLFLQEARKDTTITVRSEEIDQALDEQIARIVGNFSSEREFLDALTGEGLTLRDLRKRYRGDLENQMLKQRLIQKRLVGVSVSRHEVEAFYQNFKDSLPTQPEAVRLAHILLPVTTSQAVEDSVAALARQLRQRILEGADFATISSQFSSYGAGANGGDLGWVTQEEVVPEFGRAAFLLSDGEISGIVRTQFGYHVIKCEGRNDKQARLRHLLLGVAPVPEDTARAVALADTLLVRLRSGENFEELAKVHSQDDETRAQGGEFGWFSVAQLPEEFADAVRGWTTAGEYRGPVLSRFGVHIFNLLEYQPEKVYTLPDDFDEIKELARQDKTARLVDEWLADLRGKTYIENRWTADAN